VGEDYEPGQAYEDAAAWDEWAPYHIEHHGVEINEQWRESSELVATYHWTDRYEGGAPRPEGRRWVVEYGYGHEADRYLGEEA
jgi:hypothetical protein